MRNGNTRVLVRLVHVRVKPRIDLFVAAVPRSAVLVPDVRRWTEFDGLGLRAVGGAPAHRRIVGDCARGGVDGLHDAAHRREVDAVDLVVEAVIVLVDAGEEEGDGDALPGVLVVIAALVDLRRIARVAARTQTSYPPPAPRA